MNSSLPPNIEILTTGDGSPTLCFSRPDGYREKMHHQGGALSESLFIYGAALQQSPRPARVLSFGLGLGYNELITIAQLQDSDWRIWSYEAIDFLRESFLAWAHGHTTPLTSTIDGVAQQVAAAHKISRLDLQLWTRKALGDGRLELRGAFPQDLGSIQDCNLVYYDAYSNKMDAKLWTEEHFINDLNHVLAPSCVLATYAATGALNRALRQLGFCLQPKAGFQGKRQSTLAIRSKKS